MKSACFDNARVEELWKEFAGPIWGYLRKQTGSDADADDLLQEVFVRVHRNICTLRDTSKLQGWVYRIARNVLINQARTRKGRTPADVDPDSMPDGADPSGRDAIDLSPTLRRFMQELPAIYREPLVRQEFQGQPLQEIADSLGLSLTATKSRVRRGRIMLREMLDRCCRFEFDRRGRVIEVIPRSSCKCGTDASKLQRTRDDKRARSAHSQVSSSRIPAR